MAASATQNPAVKSDSKSAKKKKSKTTSAETEAPVAAPEAAPSNGTAESNSGDGAYESPYIKELYKSIRNVNKKITNASKVDNVITENPGKSLDDLVAARKINADQKAQILKKPQLQASLSQLEEQIAQYKKFDQEYKAVTQAEKAEFEKTLTERANKELEEAVAAAKAEAESASVELLHRNLLTLTKFLQLAAIRRSEEEKSDLEDSKALEGLLTEVYSGNDNAVTHMLKLMKGSTDTLKSPQGDELTVTYADIQAMIAELPAPLQAEPEEPSAESSSVAETTSEYPVESDPTIVHAGLTELDAPEASAMTNGHSATTFETQGVPQNAGFGGEGGANAAAEANWDPSTDMSASQEWVEVPRDATETDTGVAATPAAPSNVQSWADDQPDSPGENTAAAQPNEGFQEVSRNRDRGPQNRGNFRGGRGGRGDGFQRGRGRGDGYRGRGRGGGGGGPRGGRRPEES